MIHLFCCIVHVHKVLFITHSNSVPFLLFVCFDDLLTAICVCFYSGPIPFISNFLSPSQFLRSHSLPPSLTAILTAVLSLELPQGDLSCVTSDPCACTHKAESEDGTPYFQHMKHMSFAVPFNLSEMNGIVRNLLLETNSAHKMPPKLLIKQKTHY